MVPFHIADKLMQEKMTSFDRLEVHHPVATSLSFQKSEKYFNSTHVLQSEKGRFLNQNGIL